MKVEKWKGFTLCSSIGEEPEINPDNRYCCPSQRRLYVGDCFDGFQAAQVYNETCREESRQNTCLYVPVPYSREACSISRDVVLKSNEGDLFYTRLAFYE